MLIIIHRVSYAGETDTIVLQLESFCLQIKLKSLKKPKVITKTICITWYLEQWNALLGLFLSQSANILMRNQFLKAIVEKIVPVIIVILRIK